MSTQEELSIMVLVDVEEIKKLKAKYCYLVDEALSDSSKWDNLLENFTDFAKIDFGPFGVRDGKEAIGKFFKKNIAGSLSFSVHMVFDPIIEVKGREATGKWYFHVPATDKRTNRAIWTTGSYDEEYVKEEGRWKFSVIRANFFYYTPFDEGWVKTKMMG